MTDTSLFHPLSLAVAVLATVILGLSKGGFAGVGMVSTPLLSLVLPPPVAAAVLLPVLLFQDAVGVWAYRASWSRRIIRVMFPASLLGVIVGAWMVGRIDVAMFEIVLGGVSVLFAAERLLRLFATTEAASRPAAWIGRLCGFFAGLTSMIAHAGVPPFQFYVLPQRLSRDVYVGTNVVFFAAVNWTKLPFFLSLGQMTRASATLSLALIPLAFLSVRLGIVLVRRVSPRGFQVMANGLLLAIGLLLVIRGLAGLGA